MENIGKSNAIKDIDERLTALETALGIGLERKATIEYIKGIKLFWDKEKTSITNKYVSSKFNFYFLDSLREAILKYCEEQKLNKSEFMNEALFYGSMYLTKLRGGNLTVNNVRYHNPKDIKYLDETKEGDIND